MLYFRTGFKKGSCGRVARQSSAKAPTAVRIRSGPQKKGNNRTGYSFFYVFEEHILSKPCTGLKCNQF